MKDKGFKPALKGDIKAITEAGYKVAKSAVVLDKLSSALGVSVASMFETGPAPASCACWWSR